MRVKATNPELFFVPKKELFSNEDVSVKITDETTNKTTEEVLSFESFEFYTSINLPDLKESTYYIVEVSQNNELMYKGKLFATDQTGEFSINKDRFSENKTSNKYIIR